MWAGGAEFAEVAARDGRDEIGEQECGLEDRVGFETGGGGDGVLDGGLGEPVGGAEGLCWFRVESAMLFPSF
jgi:hypothetical protein